MDTSRFDHFTRLLARGGSRRQALKLALAGGIAAAAGRREMVAASAWDIAISDVTPTRIAGRVDTDRAGLHFKAWLDQIPCIMVTTLDKQDVLAIKRDGSDIVTDLRGGALTARLAMDEARAARALDDPRATIAHVQAATTIDGDAAVLHDLNAVPAFGLLPGLSYAFGQAGVTGQRYAPSLGMHAIGLAAATTLDINPRTANSSFLIRSSNPKVIVPTPESGGAGETEPGVSTREKPVLIDPAIERAMEMNGLQPDPCLNEFGQRIPNCVVGCVHPPDKDRNCFGMCGPGCDDCWTWVCGDCCYHGFCAEHDAALRSCDDVADVAFCLMSVLPAWYFVTGCDGVVF